LITWPPIFSEDYRACSMTVALRRRRADHPFTWFNLVSQ
jgi:hypothetical protein